ncbi:MAG: GTP-binding protein, partial [Pseudomonadota bacterium]
AGQDSFKSITRAYYRGAAAALICYDITCRESFENLHGWLEECKTNGNPEMTLVLVGNKIDLAENREVSQREGADFARDNDMLFFETSAKTAEKVGDLFKQSADKIYGKIANGTIDPKNETFGVKIGTKPQQGKLSRGHFKKKSKDKGDGGCC